MAETKDATVELAELRSGNDRIRAAIAEVKTAEAGYKRAHSAYLQAKQKRDAAKASLIATAEAAVEPHLFNQNIQPGEKMPAGDTKWRADEISVLGLDKKIEDKLREHGVNTMGTVADRINGVDGAEPLTKIPGLGQKAYAAILAAEEVYDAKRKRLTEAPIESTNGRAKKKPAAKPSKKKPAKAAAGK